MVYHKIKCFELFPKVRHPTRSQVGVQEITQDDRARMQALFPTRNFSAATHMCLACRTKLSKQHGHLLILKKTIDLATKTPSLPGPSPALPSIQPLRPTAPPLPPPPPTAPPLQPPPPTAPTLQTPPPTAATSQPPPAYAEIVEAERESASGRIPLQNIEQPGYVTPPQPEYLYPRVPATPSGVSGSHHAEIEKRRPVGLSPASETNTFLTSSSQTSVAQSNATLDKTIGVVCDLNRTLETIDVTPLRPSDHSKRAVLITKYGKVKTIIQDKFAKFSNTAENPSPEGKRAKPCIYCRLLLDELSAKYKVQINKSEKYKVLTCIPKRFTNQEVQELTTCTGYEARRANQMKKLHGAFWFPAPKVGRPMAEADIDTVVKYYSSDRNSRASPNQRDVIYIIDSEGNKIQKEKRRILHNLNDLYTTFKEDYANVVISLPKFATLRPKNCVWPGRSPQHVVCTCEIHQNFDFMLQALGQHTKIRDFVNAVVCDVSTEQCFLGLCQNCPKMDVVDSVYQHVEDDDEVTYMQWVHTDSTEIKKLTTSKENFKLLFCDYVKKIVVHDFIYKVQSQHIEHLKTTVLKTEAAISIQVDYAQNFTFVVQNAVQGFHWTNKQATIHPFVVHWWDVEDDRLAYKTYCVISDEMAHDANTFHVFRSQVMTKIQEDFKEIGISKCYYISDGAGSQYKNYKNFANLMTHPDDFNLEAEWIFTATSHGKGTCDAISAVVKCSTRRESLKEGVHIVTPEAMYEFCRKKLTSNTLCFVFVSSDQVTAQKESLEERYKKFHKLNGTRNHHIFKRMSANTIRMVRAGTSGVFSDVNFCEEELNKFSEQELNIGNFYCYYEGNTYQVGLLVEVDSAEGDAKYQTMKFNRRTGQCTWPVTTVFVDVAYRDIISELEDPVTDDGENFKIPLEKLRAIKSKFNEFKRGLK